MTDPKPFGYVRDAAGGPMVFQHAPFDDAIKVVCSTETVYSYAQLQAAIKHEREACAKECDEFEADYMRQAREGDNSGASDHKSDCAQECAAAIRARSEN